MKKYFNFAVLLIACFLVFFGAEQAYAKKSFKCFSCKKKISGSYILSGELRIHHNCFVCKKCGKSITEKYNNDGLDLYHPECYKNVMGLVCAICGKNLDDSWVETDGKKYHSLCYKKNIQVRCDICGKPLKGSSIKDDDGSYHSKCYKNHKLKKCVVCSLPIEGMFLTDLWENHSHDEHGGIEPELCSSCGRIISEKSSENGLILSDGRIVCGICDRTAVTKKYQVKKVIKEVNDILSSVGFVIPKNIPVHLVSLERLSEIAADIFNENTKGFTTSSTKLKGKTVISTKHNVYVLYNLPELEFKGVLAHEFLHVWLNERRIKNSPAKTEGFCNLGIMLVNSLTNTPFSEVLQKNLEISPDAIYGDGYRMMKKKLDKYGWKKLIKMISR